MTLRLQRLRSNAFYFQLSADGKRAYQAGLPVRYLGKELRDLNFLPFRRGSEISSKLYTADAQQQSLIDFCNDTLHANKNYSATMAFHSAPTDEAAFSAAASIFESALHHKLACTCLSTSTLQCAAQEIGPADVYLIHGVPDIPSDQNKALWAVRDFLRDRDGSLRLVVLTSSKELYLDTLIHERLRMHFDYLFCLDDSSAKHISVAGRRA